MDNIRVSGKEKRKENVQIIFRRTLHSNYQTCKSNTLMSLRQQRQIDKYDGQKKSALQLLSLYISSSLPLLYLKRINIITTTIDNFHHHGHRFEH